MVVRHLYRNVSRACGVDAALEYVGVVCGSVTILYVEIVILRNGLCERAILLSFTMGSFQMGHFLTSIRVTCGFASAAFVVRGFLSFRSFSNVFGEGLRSLYRRYRLSRALFRGIVVVCYFLGCFFVQGRSGYYSNLVQLTISRGLREVRDFATFMSLLVGLAFVVSPCFGPYKGYVCCEHACSIGAAKCLMPSTSGFATNVGGNGCCFCDEGPYFVVSSCQGAASIVCGYSEIIQVGGCLGLYAGSYRYFVGHIVCGLVGRVVGASTKYASSVRA